MCIRFEDGLNDDIRMSVAALKLRELVELSEHVQKIKEICKSKRQSDARHWEFNKRGIFKPTQSFQSKKFKREANHSTTPFGFTVRNKSKKSNVKFVNSSVASIGSVRNVDSVVHVCTNLDSVVHVCTNCGRKHFSVCQVKLGACFRCGATDHYLRDCLFWQNDSRNQPSKHDKMTQKSKWQGNSIAIAFGCAKPNELKDLSKVRAPARAYAIRAREEATAPDVIIGTFSLLNIHVSALIDPGSTYSYICTTLVHKNKLLVESIDFTIIVTNPLGQCVLVNLICKSCHWRLEVAIFLLIWCFYHLLNLM